MMSHQQLIVIGIVILVILIILFAMFYSPAQYKQLSELYYNQKEADNTVYEGLATSRFRRFWFKLSNKGVNHYYG